jgi:hypothetical protein
MTYNQDLKAKGVFSRYNIGCWHSDGRLMTLDRAMVVRVSRCSGAKAGGGDGSPDQNLEHAMVHKILHGSLREDRSKMGISFSLPSTSGGRWWLLWCDLGRHRRPRRSTFSNGNWTQSLPVNSSYLYSLQLHQRSGKLI